MKPGNIPDWKKGVWDDSEHLVISEKRPYRDGFPEQMIKLMEMVIQD